MTDPTGAALSAPALPPAVASAVERFGLERVTSLGRSGSTLLLRVRAGRIVVKRIDARRDPGRYRELIDRLSGARPPLSPRLLDVVADGADCWYALFEFVETRTDRPVLELRDVLELLERLRACEAVPPWPLESWWLERLRPALAGERAAASILERLEDTVPSGPRVLAHGDFNVPNLIMARAGVALVDWEEVGAAPYGFDAGWLLALARAEAGVRWPYEALRRALVDARFPTANLEWFERLGVLRLLYRAQTDVVPEPVRPLVVAAIRRVVAGLEADKAAGA